MLHRSRAYTLCHIIYLLVNSENPFGDYYNSALCPQHSVYKWIIACGIKCPSEYELVALTAMWIIFELVTFGMSRGPDSCVIFTNYTYWNGVSFDRWMLCLIKICIQSAEGCVLHLSVKWKLCAPYFVIRQNRGVFSSWTTILWSF